MPQYIAFLRGINVGGHRVKMDRLVELFEELPVSDVSTFIASGNVVFSATSKNVAALTTDIEGHLARGLGYDVATILRTPEQLDEIIAFGPADADEDLTSAASVYVILLNGPASPELRSNFASLCSETDDFQFGGAEIYWLLPGKMSESPLFAKQFAKAIKGVPNTTRNMTTLRRLAVKIRDGA